MPRPNYLRVLQPRDDETRDHDPDQTDRSTLSSSQGVRQLSLGERALARWMKRRLRTAGAETHVRRYGANAILNAIHDGIVEWDEDRERWGFNPALRNPGAFLLWVLRKGESADALPGVPRAPRDRPRRSTRVRYTPADTADAERLWADVLQRLRSEVTESNYHTWIEPIRALAVTSERLVLGVDGEHQAEWVESRLVGLISRVVADIHGTALDVIVEQVK